MERNFLKQLNSHEFYWINSFRYHFIIIRSFFCNKTLAGTFNFTKKTTTKILQNGFLYKTLNTKFSQKSHKNLS
jgi:hypothetical protein